MVLTYKLNKDLVSRAAMQLNWGLSQLNTNINICSERTINGKSLVGILSGHFKKNEIIKVNFDNESYRNKIIECFNEVGEQINDRQI